MCIKLVLYKTFRRRKNLVFKSQINKLYEALHVQEHQLTKEKELMMQLENLRQEVLPLEEVSFNWPNFL